MTDKYIKICIRIIIFLMCLLIIVICINFTNMKKDDVTKDMTQNSAQTEKSFKSKDDNYINTSVNDVAKDILDSLSNGNIDDIDIDFELKNIIKEYKYGNKNEAQRKFMQYRRKYEEERNKENEEIAKKILEEPIQNVDNSDNLNKQ